MHRDVGRQQQCANRSQTLDQWLKQKPRTAIPGGVDDSTVEVNPREMCQHPCLATPAGRRRVSRVVAGSAAYPVIPAQAGTQQLVKRHEWSALKTTENWIPACGGMT